MNHGVPAEHPVPFVPSQMSAPAEAAPAEESAPMEFSDDEKKEFRKVTDRTQSVSSASC